MIQNYAQAWKFLKEQTAKVRDPLLRNAMMAEFRKRALNEWGFDPETGDLPTINDVKKDEWEEEFVEDMAVAEKFNIDTREEKRKKTLDETCACMQQFVNDGHTLSDIPEELRTPFITDLYLKCLHKQGDVLLQAADDLLENNDD
jgi:hypothetical protein